MKFVCRKFDSSNKDFKEGKQSATILEQEESDRILFDVVSPLVILIKRNK